MGFPAEHPLALVDGSAPGPGGLGVRPDAALGGQETAVRLQNRPESGRQPVARKARRQLGAGQDFVFHPLPVAGCQRLLETGRARFAGVHRPGDREQGAAGFFLELAPEPVGAPPQRYVLGPFMERQPDDAGQPMRGTHLVRNPESLQGQHAPAPPRQLVRRGAAHRPGPDDDRVKVFSAPAVGQFALQGCPEKALTLDPSLQILHRTGPGEPFAAAKITRD